MADSGESEPWQMLRPTSTALVRTHAQVTADGAGGRGEGVGSAEQSAALLDDILALPDHGDNGAGSHVLDQTREEGLALEVLVVLRSARRTHLLKVLLACLGELEGHELVATVLEALDDLANETALNAVGLDHDVSWLAEQRTLLSSHGGSFV